MRPKHLLRTVLVTFVVLEATLQLGALAIHLGRPVDTPSTDAEHTVLCIGDSFTRGLGASDPKRFSYPATATRLADERDESIAFVNGGTPGFSSRDVLQSLPKQLQDHRPELVYLLVGTNDLRMRPARLTIEPGVVPEPGFPWRFRTGRLLRITWDWLFGESGDRVDDQDPAEANDPDGFVGLWHSEELEIRFTEDGVMTLGGLSAQWSTIEGSTGEGAGGRSDAFPEGRINLEFSDGQRFVAVWERRGRRLYLDCEIWAQSYLLEPGPLPGPAYEILAHHIAECARLCEENGAELRLLDYPGGAFSKPGLNDFLIRTARRLGLGTVPVDEHFKALRAQGDPRSYYAPDDHCSDRGYAEMAKLVLDDAIPRLR